MLLTYTESVQIKINNVMRKLIVFSFVFLTSVSIIFAQEFHIEGLRYLITGTGSNSVCVYGNYHIGSTYVSFAGDTLIIPDSVQYQGLYYRVTGVAQFQSCSSLVYVHLPSTLEYIYGGAFRYCGSLATINIPPSVVSIGHAAFQGCYNLRYFTLGDSLQTIDHQALDGCHFNVMYIML